MRQDHGIVLAGQLPNLRLKGRERSGVAEGRHFDGSRAEAWGWYGGGLDVVLGGLSVVLRSQQVVRRCDRVVRGGGRARVRGAHPTTSIETSRVRAE